MGNSSKINNQRRSSLKFIYIDREDIMDFIAVQGGDLEEEIRFDGFWAVIRPICPVLLRIWHYIQNAFQIKKADLLRAEVKIFNLKWCWDWIPGVQLIEAFWKAGLLRRYDQSIFLWIWNRHVRTFTTFWGDKMGGLSKILEFLCSLNQDHIRKENLVK